jgi:hypothetical protein
VGLVLTVGAEEESAAVVEPGEGAFDDPAVAPEARAVFGLASCDHGFDPSLPDEATVLVVVVAAVGEETVGSPPGPADTAADGRYPIE